MRWIYISPHFDDAVLSCGGLIARQSRAGLPVEIWTICAGTPPEGPLSPFAENLHQSWGSRGGVETVDMRKQEDTEAAQVVGADVVHFGIPDCIYRRSAAGVAFYPEGVFGPPHPDEAGLPGRMAAALEDELLPGDLLLTPLALGGHVDHRLVRQAVESLPRPRFYYADVPYLFNAPAALGPAVGGLEAEHFGVPATELELWLLGIAAYRSQLSTLMGPGESLPAAVRAYWAELRGVRLWRPVTPETA